MFRLARGNVADVRCDVRRDELRVVNRSVRCFVMGDLIVVDCASGAGRFCFAVRSVVVWRLGRRDCRCFLSVDGCGVSRM